MENMEKIENYWGYPKGEEGKALLADMAIHHKLVTDWTLELERV